MSENTKKLSPKQATFVSEYLRHSNASLAAATAGYSSKNSRKQGWDLLKNNPAVRAEIDNARKAVAEKTKYNLETAMGEAEDVIEFAKKTGNANAYVKAVELRTRLNGLLIEKHQVQQVGFHINISGIDFLARDKKEEANDV